MPGVKTEDKQREAIQQPASPAQMTTKIYIIYYSTCDPSCSRFVGRDDLLTIPLVLAFTLKSVSDTLSFWIVMLSDQYRMPRITAPMRH
jgi:hypothetical protein